MGPYFWVKDLLSRPSSGGVVRVVLFPLALAGWVYGQVQALRRWAYRRGVLSSVRPLVPVVSVGNVTAGGTGKTPCVQTVCRLLQQRGLRPAVLSRGYGGSLRGAVAAVSDGERVLLDADQAGDEPVMLAHTLPGVPIVVGARRSDGARLAVEELRAEVLVLDDGFQHLQLARDLDLVTVDARLPFANGHCFPRGLLRETPRALRDADLVLLTRTRRVEPRCIEATRREVERHVPDRPVLTSAHAPVALVDLANGAAHPLQRLQGLKILAIAGIGQPELFFQDLKDQGADVLQTVPYPDHHRFQPDEVAQLNQWAGLMNADAVVTTEKDGVRLREFLPLRVPVLALRIEVQVSDPGALARVLDEMLQRRRSNG